MTSAELGSAQLDVAVALAVLLAVGVGLILVAVFSPHRRDRRTR